VSGDLPTLQFAQSIDTITIVHPSYVPRELIRIGTTDWTLTPIVFAPFHSDPAELSRCLRAVVALATSSRGRSPRSSSETTKRACPLQSANFSNHVKKRHQSNDIDWDAVPGSTRLQHLPIFPTTSGIQLRIDRNELTGTLSETGGSSKTR
jgi:hypothetical protein